MGEVPPAFVGREAVKEDPDPAPGCLNTAFGRVAEQRFEFSEDLFNRVEIGGIRGQEA